MQRDSNAMTNHFRQKTDTDWLCSSGARSWKKTPRDTCPGVPRYEWGEWLSHLKTKCQLATAKLKPRRDNSPNGCYHRTPFNQYIWLYDEREAVPKVMPLKLSTAVVWLQLIVYKVSVIEHSLFGKLTLDFCRLLYL